MRKTVLMLAVLLALSLGLAGCGRIMPQETQSLCVYATFYPLYALADGVLRDVPGVTLHCLVAPQDGCLRAYQLSDWDVALLENDADAVILGGRGLESFDSALLNWGENGPAVAAVLYNQPLYNAGDGTAHNTSAGAETDSHLDGPNPHLYLSIDGAKRIVESIGAAMLSLDPVFSDRYLKNAGDAMAALDDLRTRTLEIAGECAGEPVILMNEALIYVAQDYGLSVADWIDRESGTAYYDDELQTCLERLAVSGARVILIERQAPQALVRALEEAGYRVAKMDILSTYRAGEGFGISLDAQIANARTLQAAFELAREDDLD